MSVAFAAIQSLEISAWPDLEHKQVGDWRLRWAAGFSGRANSASQYRLVSLEAAQPVEAALIHADRASGDWIADFGRLNGRVDFNPATMKAMLEQITARTTFASLIDDGRPVGVGMGVIQDGLIEVQSIAVDPSARGRGLGRRLVGGLLAWGHSQGATAAILSVEATNTPATRLYASLGFTEIAGYHYRIKLPA
jgi:ribosomal protein S18 acetylase RimI-like enzyme